MADSEMILVEVAYALPEQQVLLSLEVAPGTTLLEAIRHSGILEHFPEIDLDRNKVGIWSKVRDPDFVLREGDRVEIYRPLIADPKQVRKERASRGKAMKKGGGPL